MHQQVSAGNKGFPHSIHENAEVQNAAVNSVINLIDRVVEETQQVHVEQPKDLSVEIPEKGCDINDFSEHLGEADSQQSVPEDAFPRNV